MKKVNHTLTGLRGLLALSVVIYHIYGSAVLESYIHEVSRSNPVYLLNFAGPISVKLFFVISGYLITRSLLQKSTLREFAINRFLRIYPVFMTIHLMIFAVGPFIGYKWMTGIGFGDYIKHFISNALMLPGIFPLPIAQIVAWSLSYEMVFYVLVALAWAAYRTKIPTILKWASYAVIIAACVVVVYYRKDMLYFAVGIAMYFSEGLIKQWWKPLKIYYLNGIIFLAGIYLAYNTMQDPTIPALVLSFLFFISIVTEHGLLSWLLRTRVMIYLGNISFSLYMWHTMVMFALKIIVPKIGSIIGTSSLAFPIYALLSLVMSLIVSDLSYRIIEVKLTKRIKRRKAVTPVGETAV
ncbi:acyltransferase family protein [Paenibacillus jamilae]|uniref:acyltransferase family protein n=2 Tax=Bacillales TaxID=1385 RepID=UPI00073670FD|nr:acyltransferase [Paenibacillus jamilae]